MDLNKLRSALMYDQETGIFRWLVSRGRSGAGSIAGHIHPSGRSYIQIFGRRYIASRLAWFYMNGAWPKHEIDHINRNMSDNKWCNLRQATRSQNCMNIPAAARNKTGIKGVCLAGNRYRADIMVDGKRHYLGKFDTKEEAGQAYLEKAKQLHGEFLCVE